MKNYKLSKSAEQDVDKILNYSFGNFGEKVAFEYFQSLKECFHILAENPAVGLTIKEIRKGYFRHNHASHSILYKVNKGGIIIMRVLHNAMDIQRHL